MRLQAHAAQTAKQVSLYHSAGTRPFIIVPYRRVEDRLIPDRPDSCPWAARGEMCQVSVHSWRKRKTGPRHPLRIFACGVHGHAFTVYPCGHVPYGRTLVAPVRADGTLHHQPSWSATLFRAALDAKEGDLWPAGSPAGDLRRRRTQLRHLEQIEILLGLGSADACSIARALDITALDVLDARRALEATRGTRQRGAIAVRLFDEIPVRPAVLDAVLTAGAIAGVWGSPIRWEPATQRRRFLVPPPSVPP